MDVAVAVIELEGRFLISQRLPDDSFGGHWEFPGGKLQPGESMKQALEREIQEELGVRVEVGSKRMEILHRYPYRTIRLHCFDCRLVDGQPQALQCVSWRWVPAVELAALEFPPASRPLIEQLCRRDLP